MNRILASLVLLWATFVAAPLATWAITIDWSPVDNPGNANDSTGYGAVGYDYNIGTYDVTNSQYVAFLNSNDPTGANKLRLYSVQMGIGYGGINYNPGAANGSKYSVISGDGNHPVNNESWYSAIRFANWLDNGQTPGSTETGAYTLLGGTPIPSNANSITRNAGATIFLPSENEWYKAAYYNPATSSYYQYATSSNTAPSATGPTATPNSANYNFVFGNLTDVGAYTGTTSPYGAFDMNGNVFQWTEALTSGSIPVLRGGSWSYGFSTDDLLSSYRLIRYDGSVEDGIFGFRVASLPNVSIGAAQTASVGGGVSTVGGTQATLSNVTSAGTFNSIYNTETSQSALQLALGAAASGINFGLVGQNPDGSIAAGSAIQFWDMHFDGTFTGTATVTLHYDSALTGGVPSSQFQIWHYTDGNWNPVANEVVDPINDTIKFTTDSFSPFILGVPEPSSLALVGTGLLPVVLLVRRRFRRRGPRPTDGLRCRRAHERNRSGR